MKKFFGSLKELFCLLLIFLIIAGFCVIRYKLYKNKQEALKPYKEALTSQTTEEINSQKSTLWTRIKNFAGNKVNIDGAKKAAEANKNSDDTNTLIHFDVSSEYDSFIFDDTLLMFSGIQSGKTTQGVVDRMIETASDDFYSNPSLTVINFGGDRTILDDGNYISNLQEIRNSISENSTYDISFGYNKTKSVANEVIITKK